MREGEFCLQGKIVRAVHAEGGSVGHPQAVLPVQQHGRRPEGVQVPDDGPKTILRRFVAHEYTAVVHEDVSGAGFQDLGDAPVLVRNGQAAEASGFRLYGHPVHRGNPKVPFAGRQDVVDLVIWQP